MAGKTFYERYVVIEKSSGDQLYAKCPLHNDTNASFTINESTGEWFCHGCGTGGKEVQFIEKYYGVGREIAEKAFRLFSTRGYMQFPTQEYVDKSRAALAARPKEIEVLHSFGITDETIDKYQIGHDGDIRITIPIRSQTGELVNVRKYLPPHRRDYSRNEAKVKNQPDCGENRFFPYEAFQKDPIVIVEGEKDMLSARSHGINAITGTGGTNIPLNEITLFQGHNVFVATDSDGPGEKAAIKYMKALRPVAAEVHRIKYPDGCKDYVEFWQQHPEMDLMECVAVVAYEKAGKDATSALMDGAGTAESTLLVDSEQVEQLNEWVKLESMSVIGTDPKTYTIPTKLKPTCRSQRCTKECPAQSRNISVDVDPRQLVQFIDSSDSVQHNYLRNMFGCKEMLAEPVNYINAQKILFQEAASFMTGMDDSSFEHRYGIYLYEDTRLSPTQKYDFECMRVADPRSQQNYYVIRSATQIAKNEIPEGTDYIKYFAEAASRHTSLQSLLEEHYREWSSALNIEGRVDLFGALMLTFLSVTEVYWRGGILKGWLDTMVIGDTRTGKSQMSQRLIKSLEMGSYINGENAKATGVIGGVQRMGDSWVITWGAIPMNDKGLLVIDEASGLSVDDIKDLSATRSSGAVTINKIAKGEARARTRLVWLSNPRSGKNLEEFYWRGYGAFTEYIPVVEDQARYDLLLTAAREDVPILSDFRDVGPVPDVGRWQSLIKFAWSVSSDKVSYSEDVARYVAEAAHKMDELYGGGPLVVGVAVHEKIIRVSCAVAVLCGSIDQGGTRLVVTKQHVDYAMEFLIMCFDKPSLDYKGYIQESRKVQRAYKENTDYIRVIMHTYPALKVVLASNIFRTTHLRDVIGADQKEASVLLSELMKRGLLKVTASGAYAPAKLLIEIAKQMEV